MKRLLTPLLLLLTALTFAQNPLANTRWKCYMGGPGGGYLATDYYFSDDTVYGISTSLPLPPTKMFTYAIDGNNAMIRSTNNSVCNGDIDTFSFTIIADTLDFVEQSASCQTLTATWNPYFFIRTSLTAVEETSTSAPVSIYPNPAQQTIYVNNPNTNATSVLHIYSITGALVKTEKLLNQLQLVDVSTLCPGIYLAEIQNNKHGYQQKIIIY